MNSRIQVGDEVILTPLAKQQALAEKDKQWWSQGYIDMVYFDKSSIVHTVFGSNIYLDKGRFFVERGDLTNVKDIIKTQSPPNSPVSAHGLLTNAAGHLKDRAVTYDKPQGERSIGKTVELFKVATGIEMTEEQGWLFMVLLKLVRSQQGAFKADNYEDGAAYFALMGETAAQERKNEG